ncbi:PAS domain-containing protein [Thermomonas brevis]|uniref:histidine kinase n=1 Tax=Thermomonas brevis TaxID=215691 RepID=A0A7G9QS75_9GAMM|nr:HWE histidine kinase domain-containing protein [Thermomonas brevis]QNN46200.1 PAS domain-containing protein [Thermomonas brevis]
MNGRPEHLPGLLGAAGGEAWPPSRAPDHDLRRQAFLLTLIDALRPLSDPVDVQRTTCELLANRLGVARVYYYAYDPGQHAGAILFDYASNGLPSLCGIDGGGDWPGSRDALAHGRDFVVYDARAETALSGEERAAMLSLGLVAIASVSVLKAGQLVGALCAADPAPRRWEALDLDILRDAADRTWVNVERAKAQEALRGSEQRFREFSRASSDVLWIRNAETMRFEFRSAAFETIFGTVGAGHAQGADGWRSLVVDEDLAAVQDGMERIRNGERLTREYRILRPTDGALRWIRDAGFPLTDDGGQVRRIGGIARDVTEEKETADRLQLLVSELQHRSRNLIAVVRALAERTLDEHPDVGAFREVFGQRMEALARAQGLLSRMPDASKVSFDELLNAELGALIGDDDEGRVFLDGPGVLLPYASVQTLALALHELTTNALKHGALAGGDGELTVRWEIRREERARLLFVDWRERVAHPRGSDATRMGFGRELIEQALPYQLGARTTYAFTEDGVHCTLLVPIDAGAAHGQSVQE